MKAVEEQLDDLPDGWAWTRLEECAEVLDSQRVPINSKEREKRISGKEISELYPYFGATGQVGWIDEYLFDEELVLLGEDGAPFFQPTKPKAYIIRGRTWVNNHAHVLRAILGTTSNQFMCQYLNAFDYHGYVTGTTRLKLNQSRMRAIPIPLPPLPEQHRIVAKIEELFTKLDAGVRSLKIARGQLRAYRQSVLKAAVEGKLTERWREEHKGEIEPAITLLKQISEEQKKRGNDRSNLPNPDLSGLPSLPDEWTWTTIGSIEESLRNGIYKQKRFYTDDGIACLRMYNIVDGKIVWENIKRMILTPEEVEQYGLRPGDVLVNRVNSRELVGKAAPIPSGLETCVFESKNIRLRIFRSYLKSTYVGYWFQVFSQGYFSRNAQQTVGMASINQSQLRAMPFPLPPLDEQERIVEKVESRLSIVGVTESAIENNFTRAAHLRQSILREAFSGKLVLQEPSDEPASVLLERIKAQREGHARRDAEGRLSQAKIDAYQMS